MNPSTAQLTQPILFLLYLSIWNLGFCHLSSRFLQVTGEEAERMVLLPAALSAWSFLVALFLYREAHLGKQSHSAPGSTSTMNSQLHVAATACIKLELCLCWLLLPSQYLFPLCWWNLASAQLLSAQ